ncbi:hypothetical protein AMECASPLE_034626 [Ameca splendens]|uniref:Secreted protein n=1 Tax=Ameca splendens TaxID=208324 RepID=A0ABV0Z5T5_9TELE
MEGQRRRRRAVVCSVCWITNSITETKEHRRQIWPYWKVNLLNTPAPPRHVVVAAPCDEDLVLHKNVA